jgi:hypothetical protein
VCTHTRTRLQTHNNTHTHTHTHRRKRKRAAEEKNTKLKSPNFAVSATRLVVRNIPPSWDERRLKAAFIAGVRERATKETPHVVQVCVCVVCGGACACGLVCVCVCVCVGAHVGCVHRRAAMQQQAASMH